LTGINLTKFILQQAYQKSTIWYYGDLVFRGLWSAQFFVQWCTIFCAYCGGGFGESRWKDI